jgi:hypothetical protein
MFTFFNTVEVLPESCVDAIHHFLKDSGLAVPVVLKAKSGMQGFVALHAWIPKSEPVCRLLPTELVVAEDRAAELRHLLNRFVREVQEVVKMTEREAEGLPQAEGGDDELGVEGRARIDL